MGKRGPAKGQGGRPRKSESSVAVRSDGYKRVTVGPKGKGTQVYAHRAKAGVALPKGKHAAKGGGDRVVDHRDGNKSNNSRSNLRVMSRSANSRKK